MQPSFSNGGINTHLTRFYECFESFPPVSRSVCVVFEIISESVNLFFLGLSNFLCYLGNTIVQIMTLGLPRPF